MNSTPEKSRVFKFEGSNQPIYVGRTPLKILFSGTPIGLELAKTGYENGTSWIKSCSPSTVNVTLKPKAKPQQTQQVKPQGKEPDWMTPPWDGKIRSR